MKALILTSLTILSLTGCTGLDIQTPETRVRAISTFRQFHIEELEAGGWKVKKFRSSTEGEQIGQAVKAAGYGGPQ